ncbi:hypothetical protein P879_09037 [Paragonimus westermani]|uniref:Uncharacterized protein n=1 Tax=Paragonimus westermani TaxID=34504 RepID=A0A8T0CY76_9TREM|nr:hypothetical protein P879_09037 [Paragonimus westermani]
MRRTFCTHCFIVLTILDCLVINRVYKNRAKDVCVSETVSPTMKLTFCVVFSLFLLTTTPVTGQNVSSLTTAPSNSTNSSVTPSNSSGNGTTTAPGSAYKCLMHYGMITFASTVATAWLLTS